MFSPPPEVSQDNPTCNYYNESENEDVLNPSNVSFQEDESITASITEPQRDEDGNDRRETVGNQELHTRNAHYPRNDEYRRPEAHKMSPQEHREGTPSDEFLFKFRNGCSRNDFGKFPVLNNHSAISSANSVKDEIGDE